MNCRACRKALPEVAVYCPECGVKIGEPREVAVVGAVDRAAASARGSSSLRPTDEEVLTAAPEPPHGPSGLYASSRGEKAQDADAGPRSSPPLATSAASRRPPASVDALLARANLLRMRGQWAEAVERCTEALRTDPHSAAAHSLLGDIYENQGRLDKASHWYQLALEQNPESIADKAKLARVRELQAVRRRTGDPRFSWAYLVAVAGVAFLFVAFVMAAVVASDRNRGVSTPNEYTPLPNFPPSAPPRIQPLDHTDEEEKLANYLIAELHSPFVTPVTVTLNPMDRDAFVTVRMTNRTITLDPMGGGRRDHLLREGYRIAALARSWELGQKRDLHFVTVRALTRLNGGGGGAGAGEIWRGHIDATRTVVRDDLASVKEVQAVYDRIEWNPVAGF